MKKASKLLVICILLITISNHAFSQQKKPIKGFGVPNFIPVFKSDYTIAVTITLNPD